MSAVLRWGRPGVWALWLGHLAGCQQPAAKSPEPVVQERGMIVMLPGIESGAWMFRRTIEGLREAGLTHEVDVIEWGERPFGSYRNLVDLESNLQRAHEIAARLAADRQAHPQRPITIVGYSGGGGIAVLVAEALADGCSVDRIILLGAALSPDYALEPVVARCRRGVVNFYSERDWLTLGVGTSLFGTIDRKKTGAAGRRGFRTTDGQLLTLDGLTQIPWIPTWEPLGHDGGHYGWVARAWARDVLAAHIAD